MDPIREEDGKFIVELPGASAEQCDTREQAEALSEAWRVFHTQSLTQERVQATLDRLARVGINHNHLIARQVASRLEDAKKPWI